MHACMQLAAHIAMCHQLEDVADSIVVNLSKIPANIMNAQLGVRPDVAFGRDAKMKAVTKTLAAIANK
jgi:brefeldin A-resistance guanine nucleotide exchange factor 1